MKKLLQLIAVVFLIIFLTGCAGLGRRTIDLSIPSLPKSAGEKGQIFIGGIEDNRIFENDPSDAFVPSIDGDVNSLTPKEKGMMIGRQRGTYGNAMGDVALPADHSVVERTRGLLKEGFKRRGYTISSDSNAANSASATIDQFWAWFTPGFMMFTFEARVNCTITLTNADDSSTIVVEGYGSNKGQVASDGNWQVAYSRAFLDFLSKLDSRLVEAGF